MQSKEASVMPSSSPSKDAPSMPGSSESSRKGSVSSTSVKDAEDSVPGEEGVHFKYSREELMTLAKLSLSLKKPDNLKDECFNENKKWSPEAGFKLMVLESSHSNGTKSIKPIKPAAAPSSDDSLPRFGPPSVPWGQGCKPSVPSAILSSVIPPALNGNLQPMGSVPGHNNGPTQIVVTRAPIKIPPRPKEEVVTGGGTDDRGSWRGQRFEPPARPSRPGWNDRDRRDALWDKEKDSGFQRPRRDSHNDQRYDQGGRDNNRRQHNGRYDRDHDNSYEDSEDLWDSPGDIGTFELGGFPGDRRGLDAESGDAVNRASPKERAEVIPQQSQQQHRSDSPDMDKMMNDMINRTLFQDDEVTEIPVHPSAGSRILGLIQDQYRGTHQGDQDDSPPRHGQHQGMHSAAMVRSHHPQDHQQWQQQQQQGYHGVRHAHPPPQQHQSNEQTNSDLLQILQKAKINVNHLHGGGGGGAPSAGRPSAQPFNVAQAKSLAEIESGMITRYSPPGQQQPQSQEENRAFNKLLGMINSSRARSGSELSQGQQQQQQQARMSSYELERMREEKKREDAAILHHHQHGGHPQQPQQQPHPRSDSISSPHAFVPIQVMRQARGHFQESSPRPLIGRTAVPSMSTTGLGPFGLNPRMSQPPPPIMMESDLRQMSHLQRLAGGNPNIGRNSPVNLMAHQAFLMAQQQQQGGNTMGHPGGPSIPPVGTMRGPFGPVPVNQAPHPLSVRSPIGAPSGLRTSGPMSGHPTLPPSQQQPPMPSLSAGGSSQQQSMNIQQLQMLNQHLHSLPPHQLNELRGMTNEQLNQMLLRASHQ